MEGKDEIIFTGAHKDFKLGVRFDLSGASPLDVAYALDYVSLRIARPAFGFSGIDTEKIAAFATPQKGLGGACDFLESTSPGKIKEELAAALPKPELMPAAESYFVNRLLLKAGVAFTVSGLSSSLKPAEEKPGDVIAFIGRYKDWIAIKKLGLEGVKDYEVSGILSGITNTIVNKAFDFAGTKKDEALVSSVAGGKRKSFGNLTACLRDLEAKLGGVSALDNAFVVMKVCETLGYKPYASPEMLTAAYPDIKPPKMRGRKPKG